MKLNRSSSCIHVFFFFLSLFLFFSFAHCMYACICVHACVRVESLAILFSRVVFPRRVVRRDTASTFLFLRCLFSPFATAHLFITVFSIFSISLLSQQCLRVCVYMCVCVQRAYVYMAYVHIYVYVYVSMYVSIFFFLSYYYIYHGIICVQIAASQRNKRYSRHLGIFLAIGRDSFLFHSVFIFFLPFCFSLLRSFCKRSRNDFSNK